jgi:hypothetical protein
MPSCIQWGEERHQECSATEDRGYNECSESEDRGYRDCCDWAPCSWFCRAWVWISNIVCVAWTWVSNIVCVAWTWITTAFCVLWDVVTTIVNVILVTLESILGWILSGLAFIVELLQMIPILGTIIRWILNGLSYLFGILGSIGDAILGFLGIRPEKILRVCTVILKDESGNDMATVPDVVSMLQLAADIYKRDANVRLVPLRPFKYNSGFSGAESVDASWVQIDGSNSDSDLLDPPCNPAGEWWLPGSKFQFKVSTFCFYGSWRRVMGYGAPITVFIVRDTPGALGCGLGIVDFVTIDRAATLPSDPNQSPRTIGHEIGHACILLHTCVDDDITNLMATGEPCEPDSRTAPDRVNPTMHDWQVLLVRSSKHVTYF